MIQFLGNRYTLCYGTVVLSVCLSCLSVTLVYCDQKVGWIKMYGGRGPRWHCVRWGPSSPPWKGAQQLPLFGWCLLWPNGCPSQQLLSFVASFCTPVHMSQVFFTVDVLFVKVILDKEWCLQLCMDLSLPRQVQQRYLLHCVLLDMTTHVGSRHYFYVFVRWMQQFYALLHCTAWQPVRKKFFYCSVKNNLMYNNKFIGGDD